MPVLAGWAPVDLAKSFYIVLASTNFLKFAQVAKQSCHGTGYGGGSSIKVVFTIFRVSSWTPFLMGFLRLQQRIALQNKNIKSF
jgi:hypothetical protein